MKLRTSQKMVPNLFYSVTEQNEIDPLKLQHEKQVFRQCNNEGVLRVNRKKDRKRRGPKLFIEQSELSQNRQNQCESKQNHQISSFPQNNTHDQPTTNYKNKRINQKSQLILDLQCQDDAQEENPKEQREWQSGQILAQNQNNIDQYRLNLNRLILLDWESNNQKESIDDISVDVPFQEQKIVAKKEIQMQYQDQFNIKDTIFRLIPQNKTIKCVVRRDKQNAQGITEYNIYFQHNLQHVLTIKKEGIWQHSFYLRQAHPGPHFLYEKVASFWSTFLGNNYTLIKQHQKYSMLTVSYQTNFLGINGPRRMYVYTPKTVVPFEYLNQCIENKEWKGQLNRYVNKQAKWNQQAKAYTLNFRGRALKSSIKNFVITDEKQDDNYFIVFAKADEQVYNLDIQYPFSIIQGIAVAISSFQRKLTCD